MFIKKTNNKINDWDIVLSSDVLTPIYDNEKQSYHLTMDNVIDSINNSKTPINGSVVWLTDRNGELIPLTEWIKLYGGGSGNGGSGGGGNLQPTKQYRLEMKSSRGNIIKDKNFSTVLSAVLYEDNEDVTNIKQEKYFKWSRVSGTTEYDQLADAEWNLKWSAGAKQIPITADDVNRNAMFQVQFVTEAQSNLWIDEAYKAYMEKIKKK